MDADGNSEARIGWGSGFYLEDTPGGALTLIDEVVGTMPFGEESADDVEVTHFRSPQKRKEYIRGLIEAGTGTLTVNYIPGSPSDLLLRQAHQDGLVRAFQVVLPDEEGEEAWQVDGFLYVKSRGRSVQVGTKMEASYGVRFTGGSEEGAVTPAPTPAPGG